MGNEISKANTDFSVVLTTELETQKEALPKDFNIPRFVQNSIALLNGNDQLQEYAKKYGTANIKIGLLRGAYQGLDFLNQECHLVAYGSKLTFMPSYKGDVKMAKKYSMRPIKDIYAKLVREGDVFDEVIDHGEPSINFKPLPFNDGKIIGAFAVCLFVDGGIKYDSMSLKDLENTRAHSKASNSPAWRDFTGQMYLKTVLHRLCKHLDIDMDDKAVEAFNSGLEIETDMKELAKNEIAENANKEELVIEGEWNEEFS